MEKDIDADALPQHYDGVYSMTHTHLTVFFR
jgi:hypothetical protein